MWKVLVGHSASSASRGTEARRRKVVLEWFEDSRDANFSIMQGLRRGSYAPQYHTYLNTSFLVTLVHSLQIYSYEIPTAPDKAEFGDRNVLLV